MNKDALFSMQPLKRLSLSLLLVGFFAGRFYWQKDVPVNVEIPCSWRSGIRQTVDRSLPDTHYLYSEQYGWFDTTHFATGKPNKVLADVRKAVERGGGVITIRQLVGSNITGYVAHYDISPSVTNEDIYPVALGIYLDWSIRFEAWQAELPHSLFGPLTSYALEDLPSQYIGFYASSHNIPIEQVFACYLGPVQGSEEGPPHFDIQPEDEAGGFPDVVRLQNKRFTPLVETEAGWRPTKWPKNMQLTPTNSSPQTWRFVSEKTWYLDYHAYLETSP